MHTPDKKPAPYNGILAKNETICPHDGVITPYERERAVKLEREATVKRNTLLDAAPPVTSTMPLSECLRYVSFYPQDGTVLQKGVGIGLSALVGYATSYYTMFTALTVGLCLSGPIMGACVLVFGAANILDYPLYCFGLGGGVGSVLSLYFTQSLSASVFGDQGDDN